MESSGCLADLMRYQLWDVKASSSRHTSGKVANSWELEEPIERFERVRNLVLSTLAEVVRDVDWSWQLRCYF